MQSAEIRVREVYDSMKDAILKDLRIVCKKLFLKDLILLVRSNLNLIP